METCLEHVRANVADLSRAIEWYTTMLGFEVESLWPPDQPNYAHFKSAGGATFAVMEATGRGARFNFTVDDPDALWVELKDRVAVIEPLFDTQYGTRKFTIADPDGNELGFVRANADVRTTLKVPSRVTFPHAGPFHQDHPRAGIASTPPAGR